MKKRYVVIAILVVACYIYGAVKDRGNTERINNLDLAATGSGGMVDSEKQAGTDDNADKQSGQNNGLTSEEINTENRGKVEIPQNFYVDGQTGKPHLRVGGGAIFEDGKEIIYESLDRDYRPKGGDNQIEEGYRIMKIGVDVNNNSSSDWGISSMMFSCYVNGYLAESYYGGEDELGGTIGSGRRTKGNIYFKVPTDAKEVEVEYSGSEGVLVFDTDDRTEIWDYYLYYERNGELDDIYFTINAIDLDRFRIKFGGKGIREEIEVAAIVTGDGLSAFYQDSRGQTLSLAISSDAKTITVKQDGKLEGFQNVDLSGTYIGNFDS